jgi:preprotein translocase subunit SecE
MSKIIDYIKDTRGEMTHVSWPTRRQAIVVTIIVILVSVFAALYLGFFDYIFSLVIQKFVI